MDDRLRHLLDRLESLEGELREVLHEREASLLYRLEGRRVQFEESVREAHRRAKVGVLRWLVTVRPQNFLTAPIIYGLAVPLVLLDLCVTLYQALCFPVYRIAKVKRRDYFAIDRQQLEYLNAIERFHCTYCGYANGLIAYTREIAARTEQYFCPIKHARRVLGRHGRYRRFLSFGEAQDHPGRLEAYRKALEQEAAE
jgi:hypothetical protein